MPKQDNQFQSDDIVDNKSLAKHLQNVIQALENGIHILITSPTISVLSSVLTAGTSPVPSFEQAKIQFTQSSIHASALLQAAKPASFQYSGKNLVKHLQWLHRQQNEPYEWAMSVYNDEDATDEDLELAYQMYDSYITAISHLKEVLNKIKNKEIEIYWNPGTEIPVEKLPDLNLPKPLNRKYKATSTDQLWTPDLDEAFSEENLLP